MSIPNSKRTHQHIFGWLLWYMINSLELIVVGTALTAGQWLQLGYNYVSLVIVFYYIASITKDFFDYCFSPEFNLLTDLKQAVIAFRYNFILVLVAVTVYVSLSVYLDGGFFGYKYPTILSNILQRFSRVLPYAIIGVLYSCFRSYRKRQRQINLSNEERIKNLQTEVYRITHLYKQLANEKLLG
jgi:hypothetical protein